MSDTSTQSQRIVEALRTGIKTNSYFIDVLRIFRYSARLDDLRKRGYIIQARRVKGSLWEYELLHEPSPQLQLFKEEK